MQRAALLLLQCAALVAARSANSLGADHGHRLPDGFLLGAGTSAFQTEGAWNEDGKGESMLDWVYHHIGQSFPGGQFPEWLSGDVAADSYHRYKEDIDMAAYLGLNALRMSLSWSRIFPNGRNDTVNAAGVRHYHDVFDYMRARGIEPIVTIYHFDHPQPLHAEFEGWDGEQMPEVFAAYADFVFNEYGSKVKYWLTVNEAHVYCLIFRFGQPTQPIPGKNPAEVKCMHNMILGHSLAYRLYDAKYRASQKGLVGFGIGPTFFRAATDEQPDRDAAEAANLRLGIGLSIDPFFFGQYPAGAANRPTFTEEQKRLVMGSMDFAGINIYSGKTVDRNSNATVIGFGGGPRGLVGLGRLGQLREPRQSREHGTSSTESAWVLREMPRWLKQRYGTLPVFITENGAATGPTKDDWDTRAVYCSAFLREMVAGIHEDKTNVIGYTMWSFIDSFEFNSFEQGWGLVHVDYGTQGKGSLARTPKASSAFFRRVARTRAVPLVLRGSRPFGEEDDGRDGHDGDAAAGAAAAARGARGLRAAALLGTALAWLAALGLH